MLEINIQLFGGRGASSSLPKRIPNYKTAVIHNSKINNYLLKNEGKSKIFKELGYNYKNSKILAEQLKNGLKSNPVVSKRKNDIGNYNYRVDMKISGINQKDIMVTTIWEVDKKETHFVSAMKRKEK